MKRDKYRYEFYFKRDKVNNGEKIIYTVKDCKRPTATKAYKWLEYMFNVGLIDGYGYEVESNI